MPLPPQTSLDDVIVRIRDSYTNPNVGKVHQAVLKDGPKVFRIATLLEIIDPKTQQPHHYSLKIDSIDRNKSGWFTKPERSIRLEGGDPDEIEHLYRFLTAFTDGTLLKKSGSLHLVDDEDYAQLERLLAALPNVATSDKLALVATILGQLEGEVSLVEEFVRAFQHGNPDTIRHIAIAARVVEYRKAYQHLRQLVEASGTREVEIQEHLKNNPWMFGSEYSELLDRRTWTRDNKFDFMLRRTVDGFLEIVEIKTPDSPLLVFDTSHDSYAPSSKLSLVLGQVIRYIEEVERTRDLILSKDREDTLKIRARVIIGRDSNSGHQSALHNLNAHLHRIEVITFDQLLRIAERVIAVFREEAVTAESEMPPPF